MALPSDQRNEQPSPAQDPVSLAAGGFVAIRRALGRLAARPNAMRVGIATLIALATVAVLVWGILTPAAPTRTSALGAKPLPAAPLAGHLAPSLTLIDLNNHPVTLASLRGKIVILNFWYAACDPCRYEMPDFERVYHADQGRGVTILGANVVDDAATMRDFIRTIGIDYPVARDPTGQAAVSYQVASTPTTFFIDRQGVIRYRYVGTITAATLNQYVTALLAER